MKKLQFLLLSCFLTFAISCGQQKRYVSYKVKENETMRDIANRLDVKTKDLLRLNPDAGRKPLANTIIIIPNPELKNSNSSLNKKPNKTVSDNNVIIPENQVIDSIKTTEKAIFQQTVYEYETHTVKAGETVYRITKLYNISKDDLIKWNPEFPGLENNYLSIGQILKIKVIEKTIAVDKEEVLKNFLTHTVKSKETIYSLIHFYNITKEDLIRLNPEYRNIVNNQLSIGQLLKIKRIEEVSSNENYTFYKDSIQENASVNLAVLLPFKAKSYDSITAKNIFNSTNSSATLANIVTDFYMGLEIAVDSIKNQGIDVNVAVFDTGNRGTNVPRILAENNLTENDVIIGPFYAAKTELVARTINAPVIFPHFSNKQQNFTATTLVKASPDKSMYTKFLIDYLKDNYKGEEIFIVGDGSNDSNIKTTTIAKQLRKHDSIQDIHVLKPEKGYIKSERFTTKMTPKKRNWVIITSDNSVTIADVLNSMIGIPDDVIVQVFAIDKAKAYNAIENNKLASVNFTYASNSFANDALTTNSVFTKKYFDKNHSIPSEYAVKGFDITYDILVRLASGKPLNDSFNDGVSYRVENKFDYRKKTFGSFTNNGLFIVKYNSDLSLTRLR